MNNKEIEKNFKDIRRELYDICGKQFTDSQIPRASNAIVGFTHLFGESFINVTIKSAPA